MNQFTLAKLLELWMLTPEDCVIQNYSRKSECDTFRNPLTAELIKRDLGFSKFDVSFAVFGSAKERSCNALTPERIIFNPPATIVIWKDGTKTVVKAQDDRYDRMTGVALCYMKKALGNTSRALNDALRAAREDGHND